MNILIHIVFLKLYLSALTFTTAQWCVTYKTVIKTRVQWNNGLRILTRKSFFGGTKYSSEPYDYSTIQSYNDYERVHVCCNGYVEVNNMQCEPVCNPPCPASTHCIQPNICECDKGYRGYKASPTLIECEPFCRRGCSQNEKCTEPNVCSCIGGYERINDTAECQPVCQKQCPENSSCTKPDQCICNAGYLDSGLGQCKPVCAKKCPDYSKCSSPDICTCDEYYKDVDGICKPICEQACPQYAKCIGVNECECLQGYEAIEIKNSTSFTCRAKCEVCSPFSTCSQPNVCKCQEGYRRTNESWCEPICEADCPHHSNCSEPNTCTCDKGYAMVGKLCQPICEKTCPEYSSCNEPNKCVCEGGYQMKLSSAYNSYCEPVCQGNCSSFGKCVKPNKCDCLKGYEMDEMEQCKPICQQGCKNGFCFQPEVCICNLGYLMGPKNKCEPVCSLSCQNGSCIEPEICQCHEGFKFQNKSVHICEPVCQPQCMNGICVGPNVCICHENFIPQTTEKGLNHNNCQLIPTSTTNGKITTTTNEPSEIYFMTTRATTAINKGQASTQHDQHTTLLPGKICRNHCQCWQEFDEFGPLVTQKCRRLCANAAVDCLDINLCQCDLDKNQLVCRTSNDELILDDPIFYTCNLNFKIATTTHKSYGQANGKDEKGINRTDESKFPWWWALVVVAVFSMTITCILVYLYFRKVEDPLMEYEL